MFLILCLYASIGVGQKLTRVVSFKRVLSTFYIRSVWAFFSCVGWEVVARESFFGKETIRKSSRGSPSSFDVTAHDSEEFFPCSSCIWTLAHTGLLPFAKVNASRICMRRLSSSCPVCSRFSWKACRIEMSKENKSRSVLNAESYTAVCCRFTIFILYINNTIIRWCHSSAIQVLIVAFCRVQCIGSDRGGFPFRQRRKVRNACPPAYTNKVLRWIPSEVPIQYMPNPTLLLLSLYYYMILY